MLFKSHMSFALWKSVCMKPKTRHTTLSYKQLRLIQINHNLISIVIWYESRLSTKENGACNFETDWRFNNHSGSKQLFIRHDLGLVYATPTCLPPSIHTYLPVCFLLPYRPEQTPPPCSLCHTAWTYQWPPCWLLFQPGLTQGWSLPCGWSMADGRPWRRRPHHHVGHQSPRSGPAVRPWHGLGPGLGPREKMRCVPKIANQALPTFVDIWLPLTFTINKH